MVVDLTEALSMFCQVVCAKLSQINTKYQKVAIKINWLRWRFDFFAKLKNLKVLVKLFEYFCRKYFFCGKNKAANVSVSGFGYGTLQLSPKDYWLLDLGSNQGHTD